MNGLGTKVAIADGNGNGSVSVYKRFRDERRILGKPITDDKGDGTMFGESVALSKSGARIAIGDPTADGNYGKIRMYQLTCSGSWIYGGCEWKPLGNSKYGKSGEMFGKSLSLASYGGVLAVGGPGKGVVRVYQYVDGVDGEVGKLEPLGLDITRAESDDEEEFGEAVSVSSDGYRVAVGAGNCKVEGNRTGCVRVYEYKDSSWTPLGDQISGKADGDAFGAAVALSKDGSSVAIGAKGFNDSQGYVSVYHWDGAQWELRGSQIDGVEGLSPNKFGKSVAITGDGSKVAGGAPESGYVRVSELAIDCGGSASECDACANNERSRCKASDVEQGVCKADDGGICVKKCEDIEDPMECQTTDGCKVVSRRESTSLPERGSILHKCVSMSRSSKPSGMPTKGSKPSYASKYHSGKYSRYSSKKNRELEADSMWSEQDFLAEDSENGDAVVV